MSDNYGGPEDVDLWLLVKEKNDAVAFAELHRRFSRKLYGLAYRKTGDEAVAQDLVQDLFVALWVQRGHIHIEKGVSVYLFSALKNRIISYLRKEMIRNAMPLDTINPDLLTGYAHNPVEELVHFNEIRSQYEYLLKNLPEKSREVFELSRSGLTNKEIAGLLHIVEKTVEFHISKCLRILRSNLIYLLLLCLG